MEMAARGHERAAAPHGLLLGYLGRAAFKNVKRFRMAREVALDEVEEILGDGYDLHRLRPFIRSGARIAAGPYRWAIFYALWHPVAHGG